MRLKPQAIAQLFICLALLISFAEAQSNLQYMSLKFDKSSLSPSEIAQQGGKIMTTQQLLSTFQSVPQLLLALKNIYIPISTPQQPQSSTISTSSPKSTLSITENSNSNLKSVVASTLPQSNLQTAVKTTTLASPTPSKPTSLPSAAPSSVAASASSFSLSSQPSLQDSIDVRRAYFTFLTNNLRAKYGAGNVVINPLLNKIAQAHSEDMVNRQFFAHQNPDGQKVGDRAKKNGYTGMIGENLAQAVTLRQAQTGFQNSPTHFQNAINKDWEEIGVGIAYNGQTYLITVLFTPKDIARSPITVTQIESQRTQLAKIIQQSNPNLQQFDRTLSSYIDEWLNSSRSTNLMSYIVSRGGYRTGMTAATYTVSYSNNYIQRVRDNGYFNNSNRSLSKFGVGVKQQGGNIEINVVYM